ncbi:MAG: hypothetical protein WC236_11105 [Gallionellaceae bacterium]|jgi:hypothetical protein
MDTNQSDHSDEYYAKQWAELQERQKERDQAFQLNWYKWQKENGKRAPYSAWMVVPAALTDYGVRPLPASMPHWASPFIGVNSPDPTGRPQAGAANWVYARIFNLGAATAAPTMVRFYWADPSVGLGATDAHPIGEVMVEVPPMRSVLVTCPAPWVPSYLNNGHECLFVSADNPILDPIQAPFQPWADRHVGQRNVNVLPAVAQSMNLWLPGSTSALTAELRVLALRVKAPNLILKHTAVATINQVADYVLSGFGALNRRITNTAQLHPMAFRIEPDSVISAHRLSEETRPISAHEWVYGVKSDEPHAWGNLLLRLQTKPGLSQQLTLDFKPVDLAGDEFIVLHFAWLAAGMVRGGYAVTLAHPGWFKPGPLQQPCKGGHMSTPGAKMDLRDLVIRNNSQAKATLEIAEQLAHHLPLESAKQLSHGIKVAAGHLPGEMFEQLGQGLFPIKSTEELVEKVAAMLRIFTVYGTANRASLPAHAVALLDFLEGFGDRPPIQVLVARGKPLFSAPTQSKEV